MKTKASINTVLTTPRSSFFKRKTNGLSSLTGLRARGDVALAFLDDAVYIGLNDAAWSQARLPLDVRLRRRRRGISGSGRRVVVGDAQSAVRAAGRRFAPAGQFREADVRMLNRVVVLGRYSVVAAGHDTDLL